jgi:hypothetical protein
MSAADPMTSEPRRVSIRSPRPLGTGVAARGVGDRQIIGVVLHFDLDATSEMAA